MPNTTRGYHYPAGGDAFNVAADIQTLAGQIDAAYREGTQAARLAAAHGKLGDEWRETDTGDIYKDTGAAWVLIGSSQLVKTTDSRLSDARTPSNHAATHKLGGADVIKLGELGLPTAAVAMNGQKFTGMAAGAATGESVTFEQLASMLSISVGDFIGSVASGDSADGKFLAADGRLISTTTYATLFGLMGHTGNGGVDPGGGQFRIPDLRGRVPVGLDNMGTAAGAAARLTANAARGNTGGEEKHALIIAELAAHTHTDSGFDNASGSGQNPYAISTGNTAQTLTSNSTGSGTAHNNMQPNQIWNWRVRVL